MAHSTTSFPALLLWNRLSWIGRRSTARSCKKGQGVSRQYLDCLQPFAWNGGSLPNTPSPIHFPYCGPFLLWQSASISYDPSSYCNSCSYLKSTVFACSAINTCWVNGGRRRRRRRRKSSSLEANSQELMCVHTEQRDNQHSCCLE